MMAGIYEIIFKAVSKLRDDSALGRRMSNKWLPAEPWIKALKMSHLIDPIFEINAQKYNKAMSTASCDWSQEMLRFDGSNDTGFFRATYRKESFYYVTERKKQVKVLRD